MHLPAKANSLTVQTFMANKSLSDSDSDMNAIFFSVKKKVFALATEFSYRMLLCPFIAACSSIYWWPSREAAKPPGVFVPFLIIGGQAAKPHCQY